MQNYKKVTKNSQNVNLFIIVMKKYTLPNVSWERGVAEDGRAWVKVKTSKYPSMINGWTADTRNSTRRDFRWARLKNEAVDWPTNDHSKASGKRVVMGLYKKRNRF